MRSVLLLLVFATAPALQAQTTATYSVRLDATWSAATHPTDFPSNPHFSPLVAVTHAPGRSLWTMGGTASPGIEQMAEIGATSLLVGEALALGTDARDVVVGPAIFVSPGSATLTVTLDEARPLLTLVSMLAPSPDWFVGVDGLVLLDAGAWLPTFTLDLFTVDAGTDSGPSYASPDQNTSPQEPIARIEGAPFTPGGTLTPVGTLTLKRLSVGSDDGPDADALVLRVPSPVRTGSDVEVRLPGAGPLRVEVYTVTGRRVAVLHDGPASGTLRLPFPSLAAGAYVVRAASDRAVVGRVVTVVR